MATDEQLPGCLYVQSETQGKKIVIMKKMMILVSAIMMVATANAKRVETSSFNEVRVNVPARVRIVAGETYSVNISSINENVADMVNCSVDNGVLKIATRDIESLTDNNDKLFITIVTPTEPKLTVGRSMEQVTLRSSFSDKKELANND